jgi:hypothetical protein
VFIKTLLKLFVKQVDIFTVAITVFDLSYGGILVSSTFFCHKLTGWFWLLFRCRAGCCMGLIFLGIYVYAINDPLLCSWSLYMWCLARYYNLQFCDLQALRCSVNYAIGKNVCGSCVIECVCYFSWSYVI